MNRQQLEKEIISCIWSTDLKKQIAEQNYCFTDEELLGISFQFAPTYEERLRLLGLLADNISSVSAHASRCISWQNKCMDRFLKHGEHEIYELRIKDEPDAYEERYLCTSYETALQMIDEFYKKYDALETAMARYVIEKRKILQPGMPFEEDGLGECVLTAGKVLISVDVYSEESENGKCSHSCIDCLNTCVGNLEVRFPTFIADRSAVKYRLPDGSLHYGIHLSFHKTDVMESCYVIPLDSEMLKSRNYNEYWGYHWHEHIPCPYVESVPITMLNAELKENYYAFVAWLERKRRFR